MHSWSELLVSILFCLVVQNQKKSLKQVNFWACECFDLFCSFCPPLLLGKKQQLHKREVESSQPGELKLTFFPAENDEQFGLI